MRNFARPSPALFFILPLRPVPFLCALRLGGESGPFRIFHHRQELRNYEPGLCSFGRFLFFRLCGWRWTVTHVGRPQLLPPAPTARCLSGLARLLHIGALPSRHLPPKPPAAPPRPPLRLPFGSALLDFELGLPQLLRPRPPPLRPRPRLRHRRRRPPSTSTPIFLLPRPRARALIPRPYRFRPPSFRQADPPPGGVLGDLGRSPRGRWAGCGP